MTMPQKQTNVGCRPGRWLGLFAGLWLAGCATLPHDDPIVPPTAREVQQQAWKTVEKLTAELSTLNADKYPGTAALVADLQDAASQVDAGTGGTFSALQPAVLITHNPHYWRAMLELEASDSTLPVLEAMVAASAGEIEQAADVLRLVRAGPLMDEALDQPAALQEHTVEAWRLQTPGIDILGTYGRPPDQRWEPLKRLQATYPDSAAVALEVLKMRCDLAGIEMTAEGEGQHMRDKIIAAEPQAMAVVEAHRPLWAAILRATGEAGDAARRVADMLTPDANATLNFSTDDLAQLVSDLDRIGAPEWALRALRLQIGQRGELTQADVAAWRQLLPQLISPELANAMLDDVEVGKIKPVVLHPSDPEPESAGAWPVDPVVAGHYERNRRLGAAILRDGAPVPAEERSARMLVAESQILLGQTAAAAETLARADGPGQEPLPVARARLSLALEIGDPGAAAKAAEDVRALDRKLTGSHFSVATADVLTGHFKAAADALETGLNNKFAAVEHRAYSAFHAYGMAQLAGETRTKLIAQALALVKPEDWVARLLAAENGNVSREQLLAEAAEGRDYVTRGRRCEAYFALAFAPGQTASGRRADLEACVETGMIGYVEYGLARAWLQHEGVRGLSP